MAKHERPFDSRGASSADFVTTHWSVVLSAGGDSPAAAREALATLCDAYWYPLYVYARRAGYSPEDAQDLTQAFFAHLIEKRAIAGVDPRKGRFRSYLLACMKHFIANARDRARARRRGGGRRVISFDGGDAERRYIEEPADPVTPERLFERRWALTLLERALARVRSAYAAEGRSERFECLQGFLTGEGDAPPYAEVARKLGTTEGAVKAAVHRLRSRCRRELRAEIAQTIADPQGIDEEIEELFAALEP